MNHIKNIEIKNFKSIRHQNINDCRRVNVFIGYPNVGKSNILEALSLFSIDETNSFFNSFVRIENLTTLFFDGEISKQSEVRINDKHRYVARFEKDTIVFIQQFEREGTFFEKEDTRQHFSDESHDVSIKKNFQLNANNEGKIYNYSSIPIGRKNELMDIRRYVFSKDVAYTNKNYYELLYPSGSNIFNIISTNHTLKKEIQELFIPYNLELLFDTREQKFTILKKTTSGIFSIPYELVADTLQRVIFYKAAILSNKGKVLLFEEPEAHMFPPYISKFTGDIIHDENNNQYFLATHSPFVMNDLISNLKKEELSIYIVSYENETGETLIHRMDEEDVDEAYQFGYDFFMNINSFIPHKEHE